jgi:hypothetical protein
LHVVFRVNFIISDIVLDPEINLPQTNWLKPSTARPLPLIAIKERKLIKQKGSKRKSRKVRIRKRAKYGYKYREIKNEKK